MIQITTYHPSYKSIFIELNKQWIETYFKIEAMDVEQLNNLEESILAPGGEIFVAVEHENGSEKPIGVCALIPHGPRNYELAKMAVSPEARGKGVADKLLSFTLNWAREHGAHSVGLLSNTILSPAINLYKKHGFQTIHLGPHPDYERCDIEMKLEWS